MNVSQIETEQAIMTWYAAWLWITNRAAFPQALMNSGDLLDQLNEVWQQDHTILLFPEVNSLAKNVSKQYLMSVQLRVMNEFDMFPILEQIHTQEQLQMWIAQHMQRLPHEVWVIVDCVQELFDTGFRFEQRFLDRIRQPEIHDLTMWITYLDDYAPGWREWETKHMRHVQSPWRALCIEQISSGQFDDQVMRSPSVLMMRQKANPLQRVMRQLAKQQGKKPSMKPPSQKQTVRIQPAPSLPPVQNPQKKQTHTVFQVPHLSFTQFLHQST
jgi:hypothetical protein